MGRTSFFATGPDLLPMLAAVEAKGPLCYVTCRHYATAALPAIARGADLPALGTATADSAIASEFYLVMSAGLTITPERIPRRDGSVVWSADQMLNPDTIVFRPGGMAGPGILLDGEVSTLPGSDVAKALLSRFQRAIRKRFTRIRSYWVGPEAADLLRRGARLTHGIRAPREYDLQPKA